MFGLSWLTVSLCHTAPWRFEGFYLLATTLTYASTVFDTAWHGALPIATQGPDNTAGSTRTFNYSTAVGNYTITEAVSVPRTSWSPVSRPDDPSLTRRLLASSWPHTWSQMMAPLRSCTNKLLLWSTSLAKVSSPGTGLHSSLMPLFQPSRPWGGSLTPVRLNIHLVNTPI